MEKHCRQWTATHGTLCCVLLLLYTMNGVDGQFVRIVTDPAGTPVLAEGQHGTFDYPILTRLTLMCIAMADGPPPAVTSYSWTATNCYTRTGGVQDPCFYGVGNPTGQSVTTTGLLATDAGTVTCTATIGGTDYTSDPLTLRISGVALTGGTEGTIVGGMGDGTDIPSSANVLDHYTYILLDGSEANGAVLFRCVTGLGPDGNDSNDVIGDMYHNNVLLTDQVCNGFVIAQGVGNVTRYPGVYQARVCGTLNTSTEGVYTCTLTNSDMMDQSVSIGVYLSGRTAPVITATMSPASLPDMDIGFESFLMLTCTLSGSPPDTFTWMKDGVPITQSSNITTVTYNSTVAVFSSSITIAMSNYGMYTCTVINPIGNDSYNFNIDREINEHNPMFDMEEYVVNVPEDTSPGTHILTLTISDGDNPALPAGQVNFTLTGWDDAFILVQDSLFISHVELHEPLDYESVEIYNFTITPTDNGMIPRSGPPAHIIINVTDVNDNPPLFQQSRYNFTVEEESNVGLIIGIVSASDRDSGLNALLTYHIISAIPNGSFFTINNQTGEISILSSLDREQYSEHELVVVAMDQGLPTALTGLTTVSINILSANLSLQVTAQSVNVLVGQSVTLSCAPTPHDHDLMVNWTTRGDVINSSDRVSLSPENLQHELTIRSATVSDSGEYICYLVNFPLVNRTIRLNVLQACQQDYIGGILWNRNIINSVARIRCSAFHPSFRPGVFITRMCNSNGGWGNVDYSSCTMRLEAVPLIMVEVKDIGSSTNATSAVNQVTDYVSGTNLTVLRTTHQIYEISSSNILVIFVEVNSNTVPPNIITSLNNLLRSLSADTSVTGFQPSFQCSCTDVVMRNTLNYICYGPSVAPCTFVNSSYQCTALTYTGNGTLCGVDSDSDSFPDRQLDCTDQRCEQDECPYTFSGSTNSPTLCSPISSIGCQPESDTVWGIEWHFATAGSVAEGKCPGLSESSGLAHRVCFENSVWDTFVNVTRCHSIELMVLNNIINENQNILNSNTNNDTRDLTVLFDIREVEAASVDVSDLTNVSTAIVPNDINTTNNIVDSLIRITETVVEANISMENTEGLQSIVESTSSIIDNLLASSNAISFEESRDMQFPVAEDLLRNTENLAIVIGDVLDATSGNTSYTSMSIIQENIVFNARLVPEDTELITDIIFPEYNDTHAQVIIPANAIIHQRTTEGIRVPVVNYIAQNLQSYLGNQPVSEQYNTTSSGTIISSQISNAFIQLPENGTVRLKFNNITDDTDDVRTTLCVYWDFFLKDENNQTIGGWSSEGIIQDNDPDPPVLCNTTHLTSFSVLVSPKVDRSFESASALHVVSYIGCGISIFCLLLTITAIVTLRKAAFKAKHNKIHLNLSIALLLGLIVFVSGIETAKDNRIGCIVVTTLLHYFFLAVFCWALCEGIIIYILFVEVFYQGIFQRLYFFLLLGWGLPIPIVAISLGLSHDRYGIEDDHGQRMSCWISDEDGATWAFTAPMITILLINGVFLIASLWRIYQTRKNHMSMTEAQKSNYNIAKTLIWSVLALLPLVCGTWILGLLFLADSESEILAWIFTVINSLQGFAIFFFHVVRNKEVSNEIKQRFIKWRKQRLLKASLKDSTLERKQNFDNFVLKRQDSTSKGVDNIDTIHNFVPSAFGPVDVTSAAVDDSAFINDDELAVLTKKDFLQNDELY